MRARLVDQIRELSDRTQPPFERLHQFFDLYWRYQMEDIPEWATFLGYEEHNDRWMDRSPEAFRRRESDNRAMLSALEKIGNAGFGSQDQLSYQLLLRQLQEEIIQAEFGAEFMTVTHMVGLQQEIPRALERMPLRTEIDRSRFLARLERIPEALDRAAALLEEGLKRGITQPRGPMRSLPEQVANLIVDEPSHGPLLVALQKRPAEVEDSVWAHLCRQACNIYAQSVHPALEHFHRFIEGQYLPRCRTETSWCALPRGREWYEFLVRKNTTLELTPEQVFQTGLSEVARIRSEMEQVIRSSGFTGDFRAFTEFLRTDQQFYFNDPAELIRTYRDIAKRVDPELVKFFGVLPRLPYGVTPIPPFMEKQQTTAYYMPGSAKAGRPGYFYANTYNLLSRPKWEMEALTLHEAVPGHHLQIALAQEMERIPEFRRESFITAYGEGWALYSESLGELMGFYADPYAKFGQLSFEMWRAIRLVVDPGLHWHGWSREQALDYFMQNSGKPHHDMEVEIDRYIVWPGQAVSYKIGELHIRELRRQAEEKLGEKFDVRGFHDELLRYGCVPLTTLTAIMQRWVAGLQ